MSFASISHFYLALSGPDYQSDSGQCGPLTSDMSEWSIGEGFHIIITGSDYVGFFNPSVIDKLLKLLRSLNVIEQILAEYKQLIAGLREWVETGNGTIDKTSNGWVARLIVWVRSRPTIWLTKFKDNMEDELTKQNIAYEMTKKNQYGR
ncbi:hypothetical protein Btru_032613 [Bulinus truncatus]|nr:hypothetical protein Btru_032613 [Bulinus truncatus]